MTFNEYQRKSAQFIDDPFKGGQDAGIMYAGLVLTEESGEVAGKIKKYIRGDMTRAELREAIKFELGDVLWAISELSNQCLLNLEDIAEANYNKLSDRQRRGVIGGSGDNR
ncbi:MAG: nucleoside triphosphate pyrophosphohydrolase family protein [Desulfovibrio sp.]|jgi:NTP pyrophosphatase (non-canonical NTP hydrolase)|nr:nucleoside triphosphate pyrophosphohydrolase family protein [Desulfovibrio sp.]